MSSVTVTPTLINQWVDNWTDDQLRALPNMQQTQVQALAKEVLATAQPLQRRDYLVRKQIFELKGLRTLLKEIEKKELAHQIASVALLALAIAMVAGVIFLLVFAAASGVGAFAIGAFALQFILFSVIFSELFRRITVPWKYQNNIDQVPFEEQFGLKYPLKIDLAGLFMFRGVSRYLYMAFNAKEKLNLEIDRRVHALVANLGDLFQFMQSHGQQIVEAMKKEYDKNCTLAKGSTEASKKLMELIPVQEELRKALKLVDQQPGLCTFDEL